MKALIMIIDDNEADQFLSKHILESFDAKLEILQAYDGQEALDALSCLPKCLDLILLDINMPGMNAYDFLKKYSTHNNPSPVQVMLSSAITTKDQEVFSSYCFVKGYIKKPLKPEDQSAILTAIKAANYCDSRPAK